MGLKQFFKPRQDKFLQSLVEQAEITLQGMDVLEAYMKKRSAKHATSVRQAEKDADEVRRILIDDLNRTFVTPIDREDIFALSRAIDDVMDYALPWRRWRSWTWSLTITCGEWFRCSRMRPKRSTWLCCV